jgi:hypothetical protein
MGSESEPLPSLPVIHVRSSPAGPPQDVPPVLATALRRAHAAESSAKGEQRIPAFRLTRSLLGGARAAGFPNAVLAQCLGTTVQSVRTRGGSDGWIAATTFADLAGLPVEFVRAWTADGLLPSRTVDVLGNDCFPASDLVRALIRSAAAPP